MIDHTKCEHPRTSSARAKCRRAIRSGDSPRPASTKEIDFGKGGGKKASTPRDREMQCDVCGVEKIEFRGTEVISGVILSVGEKCEYMLNNSPDKKYLD